MVPRSISRVTASEVELGGIYQRFEDRARKVVVILQHHRCGEVARRGVDVKAEQQQLHDRDHHYHRERHPVAPELDEFLDHHRKTAPPEAERRLPGVAAVVGYVDGGHWKLSFERVINSMNTSSSDGSP